jgi:tetratricopeptide (TPR) repeat protein
MEFHEIQRLLESLTAKPNGSSPGDPTAPNGLDTRPALLALRIGLNQCLAGQMVRAIETLQRAFILFKQKGDRRSAALTLKVIGLSFDAIAEPSEARAAYKAAIRLLQIAKMPDEEARLHSMMARFELGQGVMGEAIQCLSCALVIYRKIVHPVGQIETLCQYAEIELGGGERGQAHDHAREALGLVDRIDDVNTHEKLRARVETLLAA